MFIKNKFKQQIKNKENPSKFKGGAVEYKIRT
jgi:hypothetical protein